MGTAENDAFHEEIHLSWGGENKRVAAFLPSPGEFKLLGSRSKIAVKSDTTKNCSRLLQAIDL